MRSVDSETARDLGERLPDDPLTFPARCLLLRGSAQAWLSGSAEAIRALVVRDPWQPKEPRAFGEDADEIWSVLREVPSWDCVLVTPDLAPPLAQLLERELAAPTRLLTDLNYLLERTAAPFPHPDVRRLREADVDLVERAPANLQPIGFDSVVAALTGGVAAGAVVDGELRGRVSMTASSETYANLDAYTMEGWRGRGYATAAASLVAEALQARGLAPVWSTGETNRASQRVAKKIGFEEVGRLTYVVVPELQRTGGHRVSPP